MADEDIVVELELVEFDDGAFWAKFQSRVTGETKVRLDSEAIAALLTRLESIELSVLSSSAAVVRRRGGTQALERPVREFGEALYSAVLKDSVRDAFQQARGIGKHRKKPLRVQLSVDSPTLAQLPWEFLYDRSNSDYLALTASVTRYQEQMEPVSPLLVPPPLHVLGVVASPDGPAILDVAKERANLAKAIHPLGPERVDLTWMAGQSVDDLRATLGRQSWHVLHFVGHGGFDEEEDEGFLELATADGRPDRLFASTLGRYLQESHSLRLVVLNACESGRTGLDVFSGTATAIMRAGVPAVVAMQYEISDPGAITFANALYAKLAAGVALDRAVTAARGAMKDANRDTLEWGTPVLYLRSEGTRIFSVTGTQPVVPSAPEPETPAEPADPPRLHTAPPPASRPPTRTGPLGDVADKLQDWFRQAKPAEPSPAERSPAERSVWAQGATEVCRLRHQGEVLAVLFDPTRAALVSASSDGTVLLWDLAETEVIRTLRVPGVNAPVRGLSLVPGGQFLAAAYSDGAVRVWHLDNEVAVLTVRPAGAPQVHCVSCSADGRTLAIGGNGGLAVLVDHHGRELTHLRHPSAASTSGATAPDVLATAFSPDSRWLFTGSSDGVGRIWGVGGSVALTLPHSTAVTSAAFAPDGRHVITGCADGTARVWSDAAAVIDRQRHEGSVAAVRAADRRRIASAGTDGTVMVWRPNEPRMVTIRLPSPAHDVAITPDGYRLATAGADRMARVWHLPQTKESP